MCSELKLYFISPYNAVIPCPFSLTKGCYDNTTEYETAKIRLAIALQIPIDYLIIYDHSVEEVEKTQVWRVANEQAKALARMEASLTVLNDETHNVIVIEGVCFFLFQKHY